MAQNTAPADGPQDGGLTLARAVVLAVRWYGPGWFHNPGLWPTADGVVPYREFWGWFQGIGAGRAWDRLDAAQAAMLPHLEQQRRRNVLRDDETKALGM